MKAKLSAVALVLGVVFAVPALADAGEWQAVGPGVVQRSNSDGSISRAGRGKAAVEYRYEQIKARVAELESSKSSAERMRELQAAYASLGAIAAIRGGEFYDPSSDVAAKRVNVIAKLGPSPDYAELLCGTWWGGFWSQYTTNATTASITSQTQFPTPSGFGPPPPPPSPTMPWTIASNSAFLTTAGGTWDMDYQFATNPTPNTVTTTKSASRLGYCDGYSLGEVSVACPGGVNDYAFYLRTHDGCP